MVSFSTVKLIVSPFHHFTIFWLCFDYIYHGIIWNYMELGSKTWSKHLRLQWYCLAIHHTACSKGALCDCASFFIPPTFEGDLDLTVLAFLNCVLGVQVLERRALHWTILRAAGATTRGNDPGYRCTLKARVCFAVNMGQGASEFTELELVLGRTWCSVSWCQ